MKLAPLAALLLAAPTAAQLVLEEGFAYPGGSVAGKAGGLGWAGPWTYPVGVASFGVVGDGLSYTQGSHALPEAGAKRAWLFGLGFGPQALARAIDVASAPAGTTSGGLLGAPGTELWLACLMNAETDETGPGTDCGLSLWAGGSEALFVGRGDADATWRLEAPGGAVGTTAKDATALSLVGLRLEFAAGGTTATLWIDPPLLAPPTFVAPDATVQTPALGFDSIRLSTGGGPNVDLDELRVGATWPDAVGGLGASGNLPPLAPTIEEPAQAGLTLNPADVHMVTAAMVDPNPGDQHLASDWEIWTTSPLARVWAAHGVTGVGAVHVHLGDGVFEGAQAGQPILTPLTGYELRVRHQDDSGDAQTEWSVWSAQTFSTGPATSWFSLELEDVSEAPAPRWEHADGSGSYTLPGGALPPRLVVEGEGGELLLELAGFDGSIHLSTNPGPHFDHLHVRVRLIAGGAPLSVPATDLRLWEEGCEPHAILLPAASLDAGQEAQWWISSVGSSFVAQPGQLQPDFSTPARLHDPAWVATLPGWTVETFATGLQLPVDIAFVPNPGPNPGDPLCYVSELYGAIRVVRNDGSVGTFAAGLLNFSPSGSFPGSGELGVTGLAVDPASGDVYAAMLSDVGLFGSVYQPELHRFTSVDGGQTAASQTTVFAFAGEPQGPSHQISNLQILGDGTMLVHMGDGFDSSTALDPLSYRGKILRMHLDGSAAADNPFYDAGDGIDARDFTWVLGVRNPFGGDVRALDGELYFVENGPSIDRLGKAVAGASFGWNGSNSSMLNLAIHNWMPATGPVDLAFAQPSTFGGSGLPASSMDRAFVSLSGPTYASGPQGSGKQILEMALDSAGDLVGAPRTVARYAGTGKGSISGIAAGPDGLYFATLYEDSGAGGPSGVGASLLRLRFAPEADCNANGVEDACDIALGTSADGDGDGRPDECGPAPTLTADTFAVSLAAGGTVGFSLQAGPTPFANVYVLLGSEAGTSPGIPVDGVVLPLQLGSYLIWTLENAGGPLLPGSLGSLATDGTASASLVVPAGSPPALAGLLVHHAYVVFDLTAQPFASLASNPVHLQLSP